MYNRTFDGIGRRNVASALEDGGHRINGASINGSSDVVRDGGVGLVRVVVADPKIVGGNMTSQASDILCIGGVDIHRDEISGQNGITAAALVWRTIGRRRLLPGARSMLL